MTKLITCARWIERQILGITYFCERFILKFNRVWEESRYFLGFLKCTMHRRERTCDADGRV